MTTTDRLFKATEDIWEAYYQHPFVQGIKDGTLDHDKFRYYIIQDYLYLSVYARVFAIGAAKSPDLDTMHMLITHCKGILDYEMSIHDGYMGTLEITQKELDETPMALDNSSYVSYMVRVAYEEDTIAALASILSCAISYEVLARRMVKERPECKDDPFFGGWVEGYASDAYSDENKELIAYTNKLTEGYTEEQYKHLEEIFIRCSRYETGFWNLGWEGGDRPGM